MPGTRWVRLILLAACGVAALAPARAVRAQAVAIEVPEAAFANGSYLCWTPVKARARITGGLAPAGPPVLVTLASESEDGAGVQFQAAGGARPDRNSFAPAPRLDLPLPRDGSWTSFWVAGARASRAADDVRIVAKDGNGSVLGSLPVMVRVRKDAEKLTDPEIQLLLDALAKLHDIQNNSVNSLYTPFARIHEAAGDILGLHRFPLFLPWHRAFVLDLERRLQAIHGAVTIPYWRFDRMAPRLFSADFMGVTRPDDSVIGFSSGNPLADWNDPRRGRLVRAAALSPAADRLVDEDYFVLFQKFYSSFNSQMQSGYHAAVHIKISGWLGAPYSPADPLFFLLHANVDRAWARWQASNDRFDPVQMVTYWPQGTYPGKGPDVGFPPSIYADDGMWPWNPSGPSADGGMAHLPSIVHPMPQNSPMLVPQTVTPASLIDYLDVQGKGLALGYCYDDIDFKGQVPSLP